jgi:hypothetical protein
MERISTGSMRGQLPRLLNWDKLICRVYHLIALALRAYVLSWYTRISPRDRALLPSINNTIITPLLQPILTSIYDDSTPLLDLVLLDLPTIINLHIKTYREAVHNTALGYGPLGDAYRARLPLASVVKVGDKWELSSLYYTSLADGLLKNGLSVEEYGSTVERLMARELVGRMVLGGVGKRLSEDWFWYSFLLKLLGEPEEKVKNEKDQKSKAMAETAHRWITRIWSTMMIVWTGIVTFFAFYSAAPPAEHRYDGCIQPWLSVLQSFIGYDDARAGKPILARLLLGTTDGIALLASPLVDRYVPPTKSQQKLSLTSSTLPHFIQSRVLTSQTSLKVIDLIERILFPLDGYPAPTPPDPTSEEVVIMREKLEERIDEMIPGKSRPCTIDPSLMNRDHSRALIPRRSSFDARLLIVD